jgi:15-cis-phytoene synthase
VFALYGFVRVADNLVDAVPQDAEGFAQFAARYRAALAGAPAGDPIIDDFVELSRRLDFDPAWTDAFSGVDGGRPAQEGLPDGSGDAGVHVRLGRGDRPVHGEMMRLPEESFHAAKMLGRAMQFINFIRDAAEDTALGRRYLPLERDGPAAAGRAGRLAALARMGGEHPAEWAAFLQGHLERYRVAGGGRGGLPLHAAARAHGGADGGRHVQLDGGQIAKNPQVVFARKVKPRRGRIVLQALWNALRG